MEKRTSGEGFHDGSCRPVPAGARSGRHARAALALCTVALAPTAQARITQLDIQGKESPSNNGQSYGAAGQYERIYERAYAELNPTIRTTRSSPTSSARRATRRAWSSTT